MEGVHFFGWTIGWAELPYGFSFLACLIWLLIGGECGGDCEERMG